MKKNTMILAAVLGVIYAITPTGSTAQIFNVGNDDGFSFACAGSAGNELFLPVTLTRFEALCMKQGIKIEWSVPPESDIGNKVTTIEKSYDGKVFHPIKTTITQHPWGYECIDNSPGRQIQYFRIKQQQEGQVPEFSHIIANSCHDKKQTVTPNPASGLITIHLQDPKGQIILKDMSGKCIYAHDAEQTIHTIHTDNLRSGIYILEIYSDLPTISQRIVITH